jgi:hypothetical protein
MTIKDILTNPSFTLKSKNYDLNDEIKINYWYTESPNKLVGRMLKDAFKHRNYDNFKQLKKHSESLNIFLPNHATVYKKTKKQDVGIFYINSRQDFKIMTKGE